MRHPDTLLAATHKKKTSSTDQSEIIGIAYFIVLRTLSLPAKNDREKYRITGIPMHSRNAWTARPTRVVHPFHRPCNSFVVLPAWSLDVIYPETARDIRTRPHNPLPGFSKHCLHCEMFFPRSGILPCVGLPLSRLMALITCQQRGLAKGAS